jgi:hypothetical protein
MTPRGRFSKDPQAQHTGMYIAAPVALRTVITAETGGDTLLVQVLISSIILYLPPKSNKETIVRVATLYVVIG